MNQNGFITITGLINFFFSLLSFQGLLYHCQFFRLSFIICICSFLFVETYLAFGACLLIQCAFSKQKLNIYKKTFKRFIIFTRKFTMQTLFNNEFLVLFNNCDNFLKNYNFTTAKLKTAANILTRSFLQMNLLLLYMYSI